MTLEFSTSQIIKLDTVDSTNNFAANLLKTTKPANGTVILTECQTMGRGQRGNVWDSEPRKNLLASIIIYPGIYVKDQFIITQLFSLAVIEALKSLGIVGQIKWPNDIYIGAEKVAGILIENGVQGDKLKHSILGLGLNVNQTEFKLSNVVSLAAIAKSELQIDVVLSQLLKSIEKQFTRLGIANNTGIHEDYLSHLFGLNQVRTYQDAKEIFTGIIRGVQSDGRLIVEKEESMETYDLKEIQFKP